MEDYRQILFYEEQGKYENFEERCHKVFKDFSQQTHAILSPFFKFYFEIGSREAYEKKNLNYFNLWGMDILLDDKMKPHWIENNLTPANGDYNESQNTGVPTNPAFIQYGRDALSLWVECAKDKKNYDKNLTNGCWEQIVGPLVENPYGEQIKVLEKLFDLYIFLVTGDVKLAPIDVSKKIEGHRFPVSISLEQCLKLAEFNSRVTRDDITKIYQKSVSDSKKDIYLLARVVTILYTREEILEIFEKIGA